jgi:hypothetical protein
MTAIFGARRLTAPSAPSARPVPRSGKSFAGRVAAESCARDRARWRRRRIPLSIEHAQAASRLARCGMVSRLPQWRRAVAAASGHRLQRESASCRGVGDAAATCRGCRARNAAQGAARPGAQSLDHLTKEDAITVASIERGVRYWCRPATWSSASIGWYATVIRMLCRPGSQMPPAACLRPSARASLPIKPQSSQP